MGAVCWFRYIERNCTCRQSWTSTTTFFMYGVDVIFASPTCTPWGAHSRSWPADKRRVQRAAQGLSLQFLVLLCFLQSLMGKLYIIEQPQGSEIFRHSCMQNLANKENTVCHYFRPVRLRHRA